MCVVGAAWDKEKARDLGGTHLICAIFGHGTHNCAVGTDTLTTFYVAALSETPTSVRLNRTFRYTPLYMLFSSENDHAFNVYSLYHTD